MALSTAAYGDWHEASSEHFVVYADDAPERVRKIAEDLERFDQAVRLLRGMPDDPVGPANRVTVFVLDSVADVRELVDDRFVAGFYTPRASGSVAFVPRRAGTGVAALNRRAILFHEYTHHLMLSNYANAAFPSWMLEGWAEYHATAKILDDGSVQFGAAPGYRAYSLLSGNPLPLNRILAADTAKLTVMQRDALYGRGWALTHYLTNEPTRNAQFAQYVTAINEGKSPDAAAAAFGDVDTLHRELQRYIKGSRIPGTTVLASAIDPGEVTVRKLRRGEAKTMDVRVQSKRGVDDKPSPRVYAEARDAAEPFQEDPGAQLVLAEAAFDARDYPAAEAAADRALAVDPKAIDALVYKAMARMAAATEAGDKSPEAWSGIRKIVSAANRLDPDDPEPLVLYFASFIETGNPPSDLAKRGLYRAFELAPQDREQRMNVARLYLLDGDPKSARRLLAPLAFDPHGGGLSQQAAQMIASIDGKDTNNESVGPSDDTSEDVVVEKE